MHWNQADTNSNQDVSGDVIDLIFGIRCTMLPVDHAWPLSQAVIEHLPWLIEEDLAGIHPLQISESGNGWMRPENPDDILHLSRRTRLTLRVPKHREQDANSLVGKTLNVAGNELEVLNVHRRVLSTITTLYSRYIATAEIDEGIFLNHVIEELRCLDVHPKKMLPGKKRIIRTPKDNVATRSLMIADVNVNESIRIQQYGLGLHRHLGCGLFIPHKDILDVSSE